MVRMKSIHGVDRINNVTMEVYGAESRYLRNHPTLEEFIQTGDMDLFNNFTTTFHKIVIMTF